LLLSAGLFLPAWLAHESRDTREQVGAALAALAGLSALVLGAGALRACRAWLATRRLEREWRRSAKPVELPGAGLPAFAIDQPFPVVSVVGLLRPRLYVAHQVLGAMSRAELLAVVAHERAHVEARDNLRTLLLSACPDPLAFTAIGARMRLAFGLAAEAEADERAVGGMAARALDLAGALVRVARMAPPGAHVALPVSALDGGAGLTGRIRRLAAYEDCPRSPGARGRAWTRLWWLPLLLLLPAAYPSALRAVHVLAESAVHALR
jgi:hypothetical protein